MHKTDHAQAIYLKDYRPPAFVVTSLTLDFNLHPSQTLVRAVGQYEGPAGIPLYLDGEAMGLVAIAMDGQALPDDAYTLDDRGLTLHNPPATFSLEITSRLNPVGNTSLEGLYQSNGNFCTQCEAEGFRKITWFQDRPDVMTQFIVRIEADKDNYPILLSNGNLTDEGDLADGRHFAIWHDPFPKPCYLFALVAGKLTALQDRFQTQSGRDVALNIYTEPGQSQRARYAMDALKRAMRWDEERFGLEYDLDIFNIVAVSDFNMGAMENKSLNIFNSKYILADQHTATDVDFSFVEGIIAHEYFHNWTGNRVTCRDWFQLSLKEGLTVFRDQEFSADMGTRALKRIEDVITLRARQFSEDAGPLAHPVRPSSYITINNFYTATVYEKGAEVIRMMHTLLGEDGFQKGMALYFDRHDGQAVTCADFVAAMADATQVNLTHFQRWYDQAGTPIVTASGSYDDDQKCYLLQLHQTTRPTPGQAKKDPLQIPLKLGLVGRSGKALSFRLSPTGICAETHLLNFATETVDFTLLDVEEEAVPSINRDFSAPVIVKSHLSHADKVFLMANDPNPFARWEAGHDFAISCLLDQISAIAQGTPPNIDVRLIDAIGKILAADHLDPAFQALAIDLPLTSAIAARMAVIEPSLILEARLATQKAIAEAHADRILALYETLAPTAKFSAKAEQAGKRALRNMLLTYLVQGEIGGKTAITDAIIRTHYEMADNLTDRVAALALAVDRQGPVRAELINAFEQHYANISEVMDKWFALQVRSRRKTVLSDVKRLMQHPAFNMKNPNKVRAVIGNFAMANKVHFHAKDGSGYRFLTDQILELDSINPQIAASLVSAFGQWHRYDQTAQNQMKHELETILAHKNLSADVFEMVSKSLQA